MAQGRAKTSRLGWTPLELYPGTIDCQRKGPEGRRGTDQTRGTQVLVDSLVHFPDELRPVQSEEERVVNTLAHQRLDLQCLALNGRLVMTVLEAPGYNDTGDCQKGLMQRALLFHIAQEVPYQSGRRQGQGPTWVRSRSSQGRGRVMTTPSPDCNFACREQSTAPAGLEIRQACPATKGLFSTVDLVEGKAWD